jgi:hypothetical protein
MAKQSKAKAFHARTKRYASQLERALKQSQQAQGRATALVLGMLVQAGGDITFSKATTDRMNTDIARMGYKIQPDAEGLVKVVLVMQEPEPQTEEDKQRLGAQAMMAEHDRDKEASVGKIILTD